MSNDIRNLLSKIDQLSEGDITPVSVKHGLNPQQDKAPQMPALFKPKSISVLGAKKDPEHPAKKFFVGGESLEDDSDTNPMARAVIGRIMRSRVDLLSKYGPEAVMQAVDDVTGDHDDWEEIGTSDVSAYLRYVEDYLRDHHGSREEMDDRLPFAEGKATEDVISDKKSLGDYLQDVAQAIKKDPDLLDKIPQMIDKIGPAVKTIKTDDGHEIKIHGNEDDGFRITIKDRPSKSSFKSLDEAAMAVEMFCARRQSRGDQDYLDEA